MISNTTVMSMMFHEDRVAFHTALVMVGQYTKTPQKTPSCFAPHYLFASHSHCSGYKVGKWGVLSVALPATAISKT